MTLDRILIALTLCAALAGASSAQGVNFTGFADVDFAGYTLVPDPGGQDVVLPASLSGNVSGWDIAALRFHYIPSEDTLYVGIDNYVTAGDADGDGAPGGTSIELNALGGTDLPSFAGSETFVVVFDFNDDGIGDIIAGLLPGGDINDFTVADYATQFPLTMARFAFGNSRPQNNGGLLGLPIPQCPDVEFEIKNFCDLVREFVDEPGDVAQPGPLTSSTGQTGIGAYVFMGSNQDATIGDDVMSGPNGDDFLFVPFEDLSFSPPIINLFRLKSITQVGSDYMIRTEYGVPDDHACCAIMSPVAHPGIYFPPPLDITVTADFTHPNAITYFLPLPIPTGQSCTVKSQTGIVPASASMFTFHVQFFAYNPFFDPTAARNFYASNRLTFGPPVYPPIVP